MALSHVEDCLMLRKRHTPEEIVTKLRQVEVLTAQGRPVAEAIRSIGVTEVSSGTNCSTGRSSTRSRKPGSSSRAGDGITTPFDRTHPSATCHQLPRSWCGRLRNPGQLRRPHQPSPRGRQCTNVQPGPLKGGRPSRRQARRPTWFVLDIGVLLGSKAILQDGPLRRGWITRS